MLSKSQLAFVRALHQKKVRREERLFLAEGEKVVTELLASDLHVRHVFATEDFKISRTNIVVTRVSPAELARLSLLDAPNKVLAVAEQPTELSDAPPRDRLILALDGITDPGNLGTLIRTAEWFGVREMLCSPTTADCWSPKVVQAAMGSLFRTRMSYRPLVPMLQQCQATGATLVAAALDGVALTHAMRFSHPVVLVIGSEAHGISTDVVSLADQRVRIPSAPSARTESLNAAVAAGILLARLS